MQAYAYVHWFSKPPKLPDADTGLYIVKRLVSPKGRPRSSVIPIESISRLIELVPKHKDKTMHADFNSNNVLNIGDRYFVNSYWDSESFQAVY